MLYPKDSPRHQIGFDPVDQHLKDRYLVVDAADPTKKPLGRYALYENPKLEYKDQKAASLGSYECIHDPEVSIALLDHARRTARQAGFHYLIGPMEGSTWNNYRFNLNTDLAPFFLEAMHQPYYPQQFQDYGFEVAARYFSSIVEDIKLDAQRMQDLEKYFAAKGLRVRPLDINRLEGELQQLADLCLRGFEANFLYTPITAEQFVKKYLGYKHFMDPNLIQIMEDASGKMRAFIFCVKDYLDPKGESLIIKTLVRDTNYSLSGIGRYLNLKAHQIALEQGYLKVIHALMFADNISLSTSKKNGGRPFKEYHLYALAL